MPHNSRAARVVEFLCRPVSATLLGVLLAAPSLWVGFIADDYLHRAVLVNPPALDGLFGSPFTSMYSFADGDAERTMRFVDMGMYPWQTFEETRLWFWRPLAVATQLLDYRLWPNSAALMHVHSLLWFGIGIALVAFFYRRIMGSGVAAGLAALLFAIDDAHAWPAGWIANRNSLIALVFGVLTLFLHDRWRKNNFNVAAVLAPFALGLALLAKEGGIATCAYLFAYAVFLDKGSLRVRLLSLLPYVPVVIAWRVAYQMGGFGASGSASYIDPLSAPLNFLEAMAIRAPVLMLGQWGFPPSDVFALAPPGVKIVLGVLAVAFIVVLFSVLTPLLRRDKTSRFWFTGMLLALIPSCAVDPQDRLLMFSGIGAMGLLSQFLVTLRTNSYPKEVDALRRFFARCFYRGFVVIHFIVAPILLPGVILAFAGVNSVLMQMINEDIPANTEIEGKTIVLANLGNYPLGTYLFIVRALNEDTMPAHVRSLAPVSMAAVPTKITRLDEFTLRAEPEGGYIDSVFRDGDHAFGVGDTVELTGVTIVISSLSEGGWPSVVDFRFDVPLEDPSLVWFRAQGFDLLPWTPPEVGENEYVTP